MNLIMDSNDPNFRFGFDRAIKYLKAGKKVAREGWNGKGMFIYLVNGRRVPMEDLRNEAAEHIIHEPVAVTVNGHIDMKAADGSVTIGWAPSQPDMLAEDWMMA